MQTLKFKTNIKCGGCIATITPALNDLKDIQKWDVDLESPDKTLTVQSDQDISPAKIADALKQKGYNAEQI